MPTRLPVLARTLIVSAVLVLAGFAASCGSDNTPADGGTVADAGAPDAGPVDAGSCSAKGQPCNGPFECCSHGCGGSGGQPLCQ